MIKHHMNFKCKSFEWGIHVNCELFKSIMQTRQSASQSIRQPTYICKLNTHYYSEFITPFPF